jgi:hypothetical protein
MDELERYLARRRRRRKFVITIRHPAEPARWARLLFEDSLFSRPDDPDPRLRPHLALKFNGSGLIDFEERMAGAGWTDPHGYSDRTGQVYWFRRHLPPDDRPATLAAIARGAAAALLGTDQYLLAIEPFQGDSGLIGEYSGYSSLITMGGFVVTAPIVVILVALVTRNPLEVALVAGALVTISALYLVVRPGRDAARLRPSLYLDVALVRLEMAIGESAVVELPVVGPLLENVLLLAVALVGAWVPIAVAIVITSAV